jgi:cytochrome c5
MRNAARGLLAIAAAAVVACAASSARQEERASRDRKREDGLAAFAVVQRVLQHPRCQNCHIPGDAPLQFDEGREHGQLVQRGPEGKGALGLQCETCHGLTNPPPSYGPHTPPGAPNWHLPPPEHKMVFIHLSGAQLCRNLTNQAENGGRDLAKLLDHVSNDKLVLWGWDPGAGRAPVDVPHDEFVAAFKRWMDAGAPCPPE